MTSATNIRFFARHLVGDSTTARQTVHKVRGAVVTNFQHEQMAKGRRTAKGAQALGTVTITGGLHFQTQVGQAV